MKLGTRVKRYIGSRSMREKLIVAFSAPIMLLMILTMVGVHKLLLVRNEKQILSSAMSSYNQSYELIESVTNTMSYVSDSIYYNGDLQRILSNRDYAQEMPMDERYREYRQLSNVFTSTENEDIIYRAGIYLRNDIPYTNDQIHIMPLGTLFERSDYMRYVYTVRRDKFYFSPPVNLYTPGENEPTRAVTLLRPVRTTNGSMRQICIEQVSVKVDEFLKILSYANTTEGSITYLVDEYRQLITTTNEEAYWTMKRQRLLPLNGNDETWEKVSIDGERYYMLRRQVPEARWTLVSLIPEGDIADQSSYLTAIVVLLTILILAAVVSVAYLLANSYTSRLRDLNGRIQKVRAGELTLEAYNDVSNDEISELFRNFNEMTSELQKLMREQYRSGKAVKSAELRALQAQINPHFLYNTLDLINWEAFEHDAPEISEIAQNLAKFYRISLNKGRPTVTIREELEHVQAYVSIENRHFDDAIFLHPDVPE
ncbi:MAG: sensor histidine kinase, partial [Hominenteromicrobium sp.]